MSLESVRRWLAGHAPDLPLIEVEESTATVETAARAADVIEQHPDVEAVFQRVFTSVGFINVMYKDDRSKPSYEIEREIAPKLATIADAQVNFLSQSGGGPGGRNWSALLSSQGRDSAKSCDAGWGLACYKVADHAKTKVEAAAWEKKRCEARDSADCGRYIRRLWKPVTRTATC